MPQDFEHVEACRLAISTSFDGARARQDLDYRGELTVDLETRAGLPTALRVRKGAEATVYRGSCKTPARARFQVSGVSVQEH
jgi:hypothetical protein